MPTKIKVFLIFLAAAAALSVSSFFDVWTGVRALISDPVTTLAVPSNDTDNDGLYDMEESYWETDFTNPDSDGDGFLDGEEVTSRHDPTIPGPNDAIQITNITEKLSNLTVGGLMDGALKPDNPDFEKSIDDLTLSIIDDSLTSFSPKVDISEITTNDPTEENKKMYMDQISSIWEKFSKNLYQEIKDIGPKFDLINEGGMANPEFIEFFISQREIFNSIAEEAIQIPVPSDWIDKHANFISYILGFSEINDSLAKGKDDPVRATVGFNLFINLAEEFPTILGTYLENLDNK